ncbi:hypothetical protein [Pseudomonas sp. QC2]|uniref:hypothetical protein n=1 Tax=Pseudomonas sp. QC2 TaxID=2065822 RepID=UPI0011AF6341|nr:hypothetical protein [Pseudomonas sp. QC2]
MNIYAQLRATVESYLPQAPRADTQRSAPRAPQAQRGGHAISFAGGDAPTNRPDGGDQKWATRATPSSNAFQRGTQPITARAYTPNELVSGFSQKWGTMNCVTVAGIKAAMQRFGGPNQVYSSVEQTRDGFNIRMRDNPNLTYHVNYAELKYAAERSGFKGTNQKMLNEANFMYAVSAKRAQVENNNGYARQSFAAALNSLDSWEHTHEGLYRLGLSNYVQQTNAQDLINGAPGVMAQDNHVVTVLNGRKDNYGTPGYRPDPWMQALKLR